MGLVQKVAPAAELDAAVERWLARICRATPEAVRSQKALMNRWERVSIDEGIYAGIDALSEAYRTGEPQAAIAGVLREQARKGERSEANHSEQHVLKDKDPCTDLTPDGSATAASGRRSAALPVGARNRATSSRKMPLGKASRARPTATSKARA